MSEKPYERQIYIAYPEQWAMLEKLLRAVGIGLFKIPTGAELGFVGFVDDEGGDGIPTYGLTPLDPEMP